MILCVVLRLESLSSAVELAVLVSLVVSFLTCLSLCSLSTVSNSIYRLPLPPPLHLPVIPRLSSWCFSSKSPSSSPPPLSGHLPIVCYISVLFLIVRVIRLSCQTTVYAVFIVNSVNSNGARDLSLPFDHLRKTYTAGSKINPGLANLCFQCMALFHSVAFSYRF